MNFVADWIIFANNDIFMGKAFLKYLAMVYVVFSLSYQLEGKGIGSRSYFKHYGVSEGLSQNTVNDILQDRTGFMWFATKDGLDRFDGYRFKRYGYSEEEGSLKSNYVNKIFEDNEGIIWVGTDKGLYLYDPVTDLFTPFGKQSSSGEVISGSVSCIVGDSQGRIWVGAEQQGLFSIDNARDEIRYWPLSWDVWSVFVEEDGCVWIGTYGDGLYYSTDGLETLVHHPSLQQGIILSMARGSGNSLFIGTISHGIWRVNLTTRESSPVKEYDDEGNTIRCRKLLMTPTGEYYAGSENGLFFYDRKTRMLNHFTTSETDPYSLADNSVYSLCVDREGGLWVGTYFGGVDYWPRNETLFEKYYFDGSKGGLQGRRISEFCKDSEGYIWVGSEDGGLSVLKPEDGSIYFVEESREFSNVQSLSFIDGNVWVGTFSEGLKIIDVHTRKVIRSYSGDDYPVLKGNGIFSIFRTSSGDVFLGTWFGLLKFDSSKDDFQIDPNLEHMFISDIMEDYYGNLWLATYTNGVWCFRGKDERWVNYKPEELNGGEIPFGKVIGISEDRRHRVWIMTQGGGICRYDREKDSFEFFSEILSWPSTTIHRIVEDPTGAFWMSSNNGLYRIFPDWKRMTVYTTESGLPSNQFNSRSSFLDSDGTVYFGTIDGFVSFNSYKFDNPSYVPRLVVSDFAYEAYEGKEAPKPFSGNVLFKDKIVIGPHQNAFRLVLSVLCYHNRDNYPVEYKLEGIDKAWNKVPENGIISFHKLPKGRYTLRAMIVGQDAPESALDLGIRVKPPFWFSWWAQSIYVLMAATLILLVMYLFSRREKHKYENQWQIYQMEKERELYQSKIDFFTNVTHEIRTPLSLIQGPLESVLERDDLEHEVRSDLEIMKLNTENLLHLSNQLLNFRKIEKDGFKMKYMEIDVPSFVSDTIERFKSFAKIKRLAIETVFPESGLKAQVSKDEFSHIVDNLLGNAFKYAKHYVRISLSQEMIDGVDMFCLVTDNDGPVIPEEMREEIFKPFIRHEADGESHLGSGIGLTFSRSLAELHGGTLKMGPDPEKNTFVLSLPVSHEDMTVGDYLVSEEEDDESDLFQAEDGEGKLVILVVEDNVDLRSFLSTKLRSQYTVYVAENGEQALKLLADYMIHLIISDVMMPVMDGVTFCEKVKTDLRFSHIPVILLTAKTDVDTKVKGMKAGADAYIEKPFAFQYLLAMVASQLENRKKLKQLYMKSSLSLSATGQAGSEEDRLFLEKLDSVLGEYYSDPEFSVDEFARQMFMSRSNFFRKIKGLMDMSPMEMIRYERLRRAAGFLVEGKYPIADISVMVGFNSSSYFTKCFQSQYGVLPKDYASFVKRG